jgi:hypothetical protein
MHFTNKQMLDALQDSDYLLQFLANFDLNYFNAQLDEDYLSIVNDSFLWVYTSEGHDFWADVEDELYSGGSTFERDYNAELAWIDSFRPTYPELFI